MKILLFCAKGFETMEFAPFIDVMGWARNDYGHDIEVVTCGYRETVVSAFGVPVAVDVRIDEVDAADYDALAVPGGFEEFGFYEEAYDEKFQNLVRDFHQMGKPIASVCVAALALGRSGILQGCRATTYHLRGGHRQAQLAALGADVVPDQRVVADGNVITSYCPETAADVAFALLEMLIGAEKAGAVRQDMGY
ncbi:MAG: DJ-1/PfpI family protein [Acutalibacter sp.]|nr:DJ-1/PfpI family protein [Acutalibacter sp.]